MNATSKAIHYSTLSTITLIALAAFVFVVFVCLYAYCSSAGIGKPQCGLIKNERSEEMIQKVPLPAARQP